MPVNTRARRQGSTPPGAAARGPEAQGPAAARTRSSALRAAAPPAVTLGPAATTPAARQQAVVTRLRGAAARQQGPAAAPASQRAAAREAAQEASAAAPSPANEARSQAQAAQAEVMSRQRPGEVNQRTFLELVEERLNAVPTPRNPEEMDRFREQGGAQGLRQQLEGQVGEQAAQAQQDIRSASTAEPAAGRPRTPAPLTPAPPAPRPADVRPQEGLPTPRTEQEVSLAANQRQVEDRMRENNLTDEQLGEANDTRFEAVRSERRSVHEHAARAPQEYRAAESAELQRQGVAVGRDEQNTQRQMRDERGRTEGQIEARQRQAMSREETERRQVSERIEAIFEGAQRRVQDKLTWLDGEVDRRFTQGEARARRLFEEFVETEMRKWKIRRYGRALLIPGIGAAIALGRWVSDKLTDINRFPAVRKIYVDGKRVYVREMRAAIVDISGVVESSLGWCAGEIRRARTEIQNYVQGLPQSLRRVGDETARGVDERFDQLRNTINERRAALANRLVERYRQAQQQLDARLRQMQEANRGLVNRFVAAVREVVEIIQNFRRQLMSLIGEARDVVDRIARRPVRFVGNLVRALRTGFDQFSRNIGAHLRAALLSWLFGALSSAGVNVPTSFDLRSIVGLILQVLGVTTDRIRAKVARIIGERNMAMLESAWRYVSTLVREGPIGLWNEIRNDLSGLWDMALQSIREWVISQIVRAAVTRLVSMFNPAGAIIQAALAIYNTVMFFVEKIQQIMELVRTIVRSLDRIERGQIAEAANWVEGAMARTLPIIISFLARLLGLTGVSDRIREFITRIQARVDRAIDAALERIVGGLRRLFGRGGPELTPRQRLDQGLAAGLAVVNRFAGSRVGALVLRPLLAAVRMRYRMQSLEAVPVRDRWAVRGAVNPSGTSAPSAALVAGVGATSTNVDEQERELNNLQQGQILFIGTSTEEVRYAGKMFEEGRWKLRFYREGTQSGQNVRDPYRRSQYTHGRAVSIAYAYNADGTRNYRRAGLAENIIPEISHAAEGNKAVSVFIRPLIWDENYHAAGNADPRGWSRLKPQVRRNERGSNSNNVWIRGHLINGHMGGPGGAGNEWNLVPITGAINKDMSDRHEEYLRTEVRQGRYFWYRAAVIHHVDDPASGIGRLSDFARGVVVRVGPVQRAGGANSRSWVMGGMLRFWNYTIRPPRPEEVADNRLNS